MIFAEKTDITPQNFMRLLVVRRKEIILHVERCLIKRLQLMKIIRLFGLLLVCVLLPAQLRAQESVEGAARAVCRELKKLDLNESVAVTQQKAMAAITALLPAMDHRKITEEYLARNPKSRGLAEDALAEQIIAEIALRLMRTCPEFLAIAMNGNKLFGEVPAELVPLGEKVTARLAEKERSGPLSIWSVNEAIVSVANEHKPLLVKRYGESYMAPFNAEFRSYLFTRCEPYMKWSVAEAIRQFKKLQNFKF